MRYLLLATLIACSVSPDPAGHVVRTPLGGCLRTDNLSGPRHSWYCEIDGVGLVMWDEP